MGIYGKKISADEYEKQSMALGKMGFDEQDGAWEASQKAQMNLRIDRALGVDFPVDRRERL